MNFILGFLKLVPAKVWLALSILSMVLSAWWYVSSLQDTIKEQDDKIVLLGIDIKSLESERLILRGSIEEQNKSIEKYRLRGVELQDKLNSVSEEIKRNKKKYEEYIREILNSVTPKSCEDAIVWHSQFMRKFEEKYSSSEK